MHFDQAALADVHSQRCVSGIAAELRCGQAAYGLAAAMA
jgi:hypothetical protein